jgi:hypothetical protein
MAEYDDPFFHEQKFIKKIYNQLKMKLKTTVTIEAPGDNEHLDQIFSTDSQKLLGVIENNLHTPEKGRTSVQFRDGSLHQLIHEQQMPDNGKIRIRIPCYGKWLILCIENTLPAESSEPALKHRF